MQSSSESLKTWQHHLSSRCTNSQQTLSIKWGTISILHSAFKTPQRHCKTSRLSTVLQASFACLKNECIIGLVYFNLIFLFGVLLREGENKWAQVFTQAVIFLQRKIIFRPVSAQWLANVFPLNHDNLVCFSSNAMFVAILIRLDEANLSPIHYSPATSWLTEKFRYDCVFAHNKRSDHQIVVTFVRFMNHYSDCNNRKAGCGEKIDTNVLNRGDWHTLNTTVSGGRLQA